MPQDLCYVHNFASPREPVALELPPGEGARLRDQLDRLSEEEFATFHSLNDQIAKVLHGG